MNLTILEPERSTTICTIFWGTLLEFQKAHIPIYKDSGVDSWGAGVAGAPPEIEGSEKGQSLILAITASTSGFEKLSTALKSYWF